MGSAPPPIVHALGQPRARSPSPPRTPRPSRRQFVREGLRGDGRSWRTAMSCFLGSAYYAVWLGLCFHFFGCRFALGFIVYPFF